MRLSDFTILELYSGVIQAGAGVDPKRISVVDIHIGAPVPSAHRCSGFF
jgi:hypothetical protein